MSINLLRRLFPAPRLSLVLALTWPVLNQSWSLGQILLGVFLALSVPWFTAPVHAKAPVLRHPGRALRLALHVLQDIVSSNIAVARLILGPESNIRPRFVWLPLSITHPYGVVTLAGVITMTPGTLSAELTPDHRYLLIHVFNMDDEAALIASIKTRYEAPLMEIFQ